MAIASMAVVIENSVSAVANTVTVSILTYFQITSPFNEIAMGKTQKYFEIRLALTKSMMANKVLVNFRPVNVQQCFRIGTLIDNQTLIDSSSISTLLPTIQATPR